MAEKEIYGTGDLAVLSGTKPTLVAKTNPTPETYQTQDFDINAWVASVLKERYGTDGSNRDFRRLNRYITSKEGMKALADAKAAHKLNLEANQKIRQFLDQLKALETAKPAETTNTIEKLLKVATPERIQPAQPAWTSTNATMQPGLDSYKIESGNTLGQIVATYNKLNETKLTWQDVAKWNGVDEKKLKIGQIINFKPNETITTETTTPKTTNVSSNTSTSQVNLNTESTESSTTTTKDRRTQDREDFHQRMIKLGFVYNADTNSYSKPKKSATNNASAKNETLNEEVTIPSFKGNKSYYNENTARAHFDYLFSNYLGNPYMIQGKGVYKNRRAIDVEKLRNHELYDLTWFNFINQYLDKRKNGFEGAVVNRYVLSDKKGGTMNRINYFQQGGAAPAAQTGQAEAFIQAVLQGDPEAIQQLMQLANDGNQLATQLVLTILSENEKGNPDVAKAAQVINQFMQQASVHKYGSKLNYIRSLKYAKGGKTCPACELKVEMKKCGGKKTKKRYFGGWM